MILFCLCLVMFNLKFINIVHILMKMKLELEEVYFINYILILYYIFINKIG